MTLLETVDTTRPVRVARYAMCEPRHFGVRYRINPWMEPSRRVDRRRALAQWRDLRAVYRDLGHEVEHVAPAPGLPDMVFTANAGLVLDGTAWLSRFRFPERQPEEAGFARFFEGLAGVDRVVVAEHVHEGQGDFLRVGRTLLAASGFRTSRRAHGEAERLFAGGPSIDEVVALRLVDPRWYHLDTAVLVVDEQTIAYHRAAFDGPSRERLLERWPDAIVADLDDALMLGLNGVSDGRHVVLPAAARRLHAQVAERGFEVVPVDVSEFLAAGGAVRCMTLDLPTLDLPPADGPGPREEP